MEDIVLIKIYDRINRGERAALVTITDENGSTPRKIGSIMAVCSDRKIYGSIGGGKVELSAINKSMECIENGESCSFHYKLNEEDLGMECGGEVKGFIKVFSPKIKLIIIGAGHIGKSINKLAKVLGMYTVVFDHREEYASKDRFADADELIVGDIEETLKNYKINKGDNIVVVSNSHEIDKKALRIMVMKDSSYIGIIGSERKIKHIMDELINEGIPKESLMEVYAPMGLDIASRLPEEIALGTLSEILLIKNNGSLNHMRDLKKIWD